MRRITLSIAVLAFLGALGGTAWYHLFREVPVRFESDEEHFKYGSVGVEAASGIPLLIWQALPRLFGDKLGGAQDYGAFGFVFEQGRDMPIGLPVKTVGFPRVGVNCGLCHNGVVSTGPGEATRVVLGAPNTVVDVQRYLGFLFACASDPRFQADDLMPQIEAQHRLSTLEGLLYRFLIIPQTKRALLEQKRQLAWMASSPDAGPGRVEPFNPAKVQVLGRPYDGTLGNADIVPLWNFKARKNFAYHWDGLNTSLTEVFLNSGIGNGASARSIDRGSLERIQRWVTELDPAPYPFQIEPELAAKGKLTFERHCAGCHAFGGEKTGTVLPLSRIGTDRERFDSWTEEASRAFNSLDKYPWRYTSFRKTGGYAAVALDGIWARAPYLHNGSVPTLWDLLTEPASRPIVFFRGSPSYDRKRVGFVADGSSPGPALRPFDTRARGNGNGGHAFGVDLPDDEKWSLIEHLKSL